MRIYLLLLSSLLSLLTSVSFGAEADSVTIPDSLKKHTFQIELSKGYVSGIMIVSEGEDNIMGSMINEFGVSAIDFSYNKKSGKIRLKNVIGFLNKWYIKMILKNDISYCLHILYGTPYTKKAAYEVCRTEDKVSIINKKRHITYTFSPLSQELNTNETQE